MTQSKHLQLKLTFSDRVDIQELLSKGISKSEIAKILGISRSTIKRERKRCLGDYIAEDAQLNAEEIKAKKDQNGSRYRNEIKFRLDQLENKIQTLENLIKGTHDTPTS
jgi:IS30 family transposase